MQQFDRGIDFASGTFSLGNAASQGAKFIMRYSAGAASDINHPSHSANAWKLCKQTEIQDTLAAGMDFVANSEWYESRVTEGYNAGHQDGVADLAFWQSRGLAQGAAVYYSWDEGQPNPSKHGALAEYFRGVADVYQGYYDLGLYGGDPAINAMLDLGRIKYGWLAMASSWSYPLVPPYQPGSNWLQAAKDLAPKTRANIHQNGNRWYNGQADEDVILHAPVGSHLEAHGGSTPPQPIQPPTLHRPWPTYMKPGNFFGLITGPAVSHGGYYVAERPDVKAIQQRFIVLGRVPGITDPNSSWADGKFEQPTKDVVAKWQHDLYASTTSRPGEIWQDDWEHLFTY